MNNEKMLRILMLEDSSDDINLIERVLRKSNMVFTANHVDSKEEFTAAIKNFKPDIVLSDHGLPQFNSREALKICLRERSSMPFIIVTGTMSDEFAISCLHEGADDYILKSNLSRLPLAIRRAVKERRLEKLKREARHALRRQNEELMKVNKELDNFVYSVSHNLRGPLASVLGLLNVARLEDVNSTLATVHSMMDVSMRKLDETLKEIIDFSRNARSEVVVARVDWNQVFSKSLDALEYLKSFNEVKITLDLKNSISFYSDERRIRAILINLLSNAIIFMDEKKSSEVVVEITSSRDNAKIVVRDNGVGIQAGSLPKVFDMFYRGSEGSQGAGLGLYITREIVRRLRGEVQIASVPGQETIVTLTLPNELPTKLT
jgi:signal transduction histidine kinase